ncbi:MAG TPA: MFS transporter [Flavobacteriales bacterium]|nr:MFS transporter [Flavobacteriales bacterium]
MTKQMPDGARLWNRNFIFASLSYFLVACAFSLLVPTIPIFLQEELHVETTRIGIVLSSYVFALLAIRPFSGYLVDRYPRKPLLLLSTLLFVLAFAGYYFAFTVTFFIVLRFVHGLFWGLSTVSANTVAIDVIPSARRSEGIGYFGVNMNVAMALAPFIGVRLYTELGFPALITATLIMGLLSIAAAALIKLPTRRSIVKDMPLSLDRFILVKALPVMFNQLFLAFGWGTLVAFAVLYAMELGISNPGVFFLFLAGGIVLSRVVSGRLVDRGHLHVVMVASMVLIVLGFASFALFQGLMPFLLSSLLIGLGFGSLFPALQSIYVAMAPASQRGTANSTYLTGFDLGIGMGMLAGAWLVKQVGFSNMFLLTGLLALAALLIYWTVSRPVYERHRLQ